MPPFFYACFDVAKCIKKEAECLVVLSIEKYLKGYIIRHVKRTRKDKTEYSLTDTLP